MLQDYENGKDSIIASLCGSASRDEEGTVAEILDAFPDLKEWKNQLNRLIGDLQSHDEGVPPTLDQAVIEMVERGGAEDPWFIILEVASEAADASSGIQHGAPLTADSAPLREAAEIRSASSEPSLKLGVRGCFDRVERVEGQNGVLLHLAWNECGPCVGVLMTAAHVPIANAQLEWATQTGQLIQVTTDARGAFFIDGDKTACRISIGPPANIEYLLV